MTSFSANPSCVFIFLHWLWEKCRHPVIFTMPTFFKITSKRRIVLNCACYAQIILFTLHPMKRKYLTSTLNVNTGDTRRGYVELHPHPKWCSVKWDSDGIEFNTAVFSALSEQEMSAAFGQRICDIVAAHPRCRVTYSLAFSPMFGYAHGIDPVAAEEIRQLVLTTWETVLNQVVKPNAL